MEWKHLGTEALIALYLLKTKTARLQPQRFRHDRVELHSRRNTPRLCNMHSPGTISYGMKELMGAQLQYPP